MHHTGMAIIAARTARNLTQAELATKAGVNAGYLSEVENGKKTPSQRWLRDVEEALVSIEGTA